MKFFSIFIWDPWTESEWSRTERIREINDRTGTKYFEKSRTDSNQDQENLKISDRSGPGPRKI